jgi:hypothetical protein
MGKIMHLSPSSLLVIGLPQRDARPPAGFQSRCRLPLVAVVLAACFSSMGFAQDEIPKGELIAPLSETDPPRDLVLEMMDGRTLVGRFDPVRRILKTSGAIKAEIYVRNLEVKAWYEGVPESAKAISSPDIKPEPSKPILLADDLAWKAKVPPYRLNLLDAKEAGDYQKRFSLIELDASLFESWDVAKKGYTKDNPLVMIDGREEDH